MSDHEVSARQLERLAYRRRQNRRRSSTALVMTLVVLVALVVVVTSAPGWDRVRETYFSWDDATKAFPAIAKAFLTNIGAFLAAEVLILALALLVAVIRVVPSAWMAPLKVVTTVYTDVFRGTPTLLVVYLVGFGIPALGLQGAPTSLFWLGVIALTLSYGAYVAEVIRAGILSVHPSQWASGRALGLTYRSTLRHVILPQALRRVTPPLLNDFVSLQKDTALLSSIGLVEAFRQAQIDSARDFNFTPIVVAAAFFIVATIPLARLTDWLSLRAARRQSGEL